MLILFFLIFVEDTKIAFRYNFIVPLKHNTTSTEEIHFQILDSLVDELKRVYLQYTFG